MNKKNHLPIFGVGPLYGIIIILLTVGGILLTSLNVITTGRVNIQWLRIIFIIVGIILIAIGILIWVPAAIGKNNIDKYIMEEKLCTTGVFGIVRNPCYSGIMLACDGAIFIANNFWLLILPLFFYIFMTILMKYTEEKWLLEKFKEPYKEYLQNVNRCFPWFRKKKRD